MTTVPALCSRALECPSASEHKEKQPDLLQFAAKIESKKNGNHRKTRQRRKETEVQVSPAQPLPALRSSSRVPSQVRRLPSLLPFARPQGRNSGRRQVELVE